MALLNAATGITSSGFPTAITLTVLSWKNLTPSWAAFSASMEMQTYSFWSGMPLPRNYVISSQFSVSRPSYSLGNMPCPGLYTGTTQFLPAGIPYLPNKFGNEHQVFKKKKKKLRMESHSCGLARYTMAFNFPMFKILLVLVMTSFRKFRIWRYEWNEEHTGMECPARALTHHTSRSAPSTRSGKKTISKRSSR